MAGTDTCHIGAEIKAARRASGKSIDDIAEQICVRPCYLRAIENGEREKLPERAFAVGFVKAYASAVGLDGIEACEAFKLKFAEQSIDMPDFTDVPVRPRRRFAASWLFTLVAPIGLAVSWLVMATPGHIAPVDLASGLGADLLVQSVEPAAELVVQPVQAAAEAAVDVRTPAKSVMTAGLTLSAEEETWLQLKKAEGEMLFNGVLAAGEAFEGSLADGVLLTTSNAGGIRLSFDDNRLPGLGARGEIVENISLDISELGSRVAENTQVR